jgi:hypothetical protein
MSDQNDYRVGDFLHRPLDLSDGDVVEVFLNNPANVVLLDPANFERYRNRQKSQYSSGGYVTGSSFRLAAPHAGRWYLVVDLGGMAGSVTAYYRVLTNAPAPALPA